MKNNISHSELDSIHESIKDDYKALEKFNRLLNDMSHLDTAIFQKKAAIEHGKDYHSYFQLRTHRRGLAILYNAKKSVIKKLRSLVQKNLFD